MTWKKIRQNITDCAKIVHLIESFKFEQYIITMVFILLNTSELATCHWYFKFKTIFHNTHKKKCLTDQR